jgi:hypothetical protein
MSEINSHITVKSTHVPTTNSIAVPSNHAQSQTTKNIPTTSNHAQNLLGLDLKGRIQEYKDDAKCRAYIKKTEERIFPCMTVLYKDLSKHLIGNEGGRADLEMPPAKFDFDSSSSKKVAEYNPNRDSQDYNSITFYQSAYKLFSAMDKARNEMKKYEGYLKNDDAAKLKYAEMRSTYQAIKFRLDMAIGHELAHQTLDNVEERIIAKYPSKFKFDPVYKEGPNRRLNEGLAEFMGAYAATTLKGEQHDVKSVAIQALRMTYWETAMLADKYERINDTFYSWLPRQTKSTLESTVEYDVLLTYQYPLLGASEDALEHPEMAPAEFIGKVFIAPERFSNTSKLAMHNNSKMIELTKEFTNADIKNDRDIRRIIKLKEECYKEIMDEAYKRIKNEMKEDTE